LFTDEDIFTVVIPKTYRTSERTHMHQPRRRRDKTPAHTIKVLSLKVVNSYSKIMLSGRKLTMTFLF